MPGQLSRLQFTFRLMFSYRCASVRCSLFHSSDVVHAFRRISIHLHPDKTPAIGAEEAFKLLSVIKERLLSEIEKKA